MNILSGEIEKVVFTHKVTTNLGVVKIEVVVTDKKMEVRTEAEGFKLEEHLAKELSITAINITAEKLNNGGLFKTIKVERKDVLNGGVLNEEVLN